MVLPNEKEIIEVLKRNQINFAALFGSRAKGLEQKDSDYDLLIEFSSETEVGLVKLEEIEDELSEILGGKVDLITVGGIDKHIESDVMDTMKIIYDVRAGR